MSYLEGDATDHVNTIVYTKSCKVMVKPFTKTNFVLRKGTNVLKGDNMYRGYVSNKRYRDLSQPTGKPYTGEWYQPTGSHVTPSEESVRAFPSDTECVCLIDTMPDYACKSCKGTGKFRSLSLYEKTLKRIGKSNARTGYDSSPRLNTFDIGIQDSLTLKYYVSSVFASFSTNKR